MTQRKASTLNDQTVWLSVLLLVLLSGCGGTRDYGPAPAFELHTAAEQPRTLASFGIGDAQQPGENHLLINFWASWCKPCIEEIPLLKDFAASHTGRTQVIGIAVDRTEPAKAFAQRLEINYPVLFGEYQQVSDILRGYGNEREVLPYTVLVSPDGKIVWRHAGLLRLRDLQRLPL